MTIPIYLYFMVASFIASVTVYFGSSSAPKYLKLFPPFLILTIAVELIGTYLLSIGRFNVSLYNFFTAFEFAFYLYIIKLVITNSVVKKIITYVTILYLLCAVANIVFIQKMKVFHTVTYAFGCLLIVAACVYYFLELFKISQPVKLINNPAFWICSGLLFFYCCGFPLYGMFNFLTGISKLIISNFYNIVLILNVFLYTLFTIAFLCRLKVRKYTLSPS